MKLSEMKQLLEEQGIQLTKSLGQNFLHDGNQLRRIVTAAELKPEDKVLEIGPGLGPLTEMLLETAGHVLAIEKDERLVQALRQRFARALTNPSSTGGTPVFHLEHDDALDFLRRERRDWREWKLVANLPFSVASPILVELALSEHNPKLIVVTLQLEVTKRLMASPGSADYGVLTLLTQLDYEPVESFRIPAGCFFPQPDVDSACISLRRRAQALLPVRQRPAFVRVVKRSFSQRRKLMQKLLREDWQPHRLATVFKELELVPQVRAEEVSLEQFVRLTRFLDKDSLHE